MLQKNAIEIYKEILSGKRVQFPKKFWIDNGKPNYSAAKDITIFLIEEVLKWNEEELKKNISRRVFIENGLNGMLCTIFDNSLYQVINNAYPGKYHEWEFSPTPSSFWNLETAKQATKWLIEEKLKWNKEKVKRQLRSTTFSKNGLKVMLNNLFNGSPYKAINNAYPGEYYEWELYYTRRGFWNLETAKQATKWLIEEKLEWTKERAERELYPRIFDDNGLLYMLTKYFNNDVSLALREVYGE